MSFIKRWYGLCQSSSFITSPGNSMKQLISRKAFGGLTSAPKLLRVSDMPGPRPVLPIIGTDWIYKPFGRFNPEDTYTTVTDELYKKYGPVYREKKGKKWIVHLHGRYDIAKVLSEKDMYPLRAENKAGVAHRRENTHLYRTVGITDAQGEEWKELRAKCNVPMMGTRLTKTFLPRNSPMADDFMDLIRQRRDPVTGWLNNVESYMDRFGMEALWMNSFGDRSGIFNIGQNEEMEVFLKCSVRYFRLLNELLGVDLERKLYSCPNCLESVRVETQIRKIIATHFNRKKNEWVKSGKKLDYPCFVGTFLEENKLDERDIIMVIMDSVIAGTTTTSTFISIFLHRLSKEKRVLENLYKEIDSVIADPHDIVSLDVIRKMPYVCATIKEGFRCMSIIPNLMKLYKHDIFVGRYKIPAQTPIVLETKHSNNNEENFKDAHLFIPERFLASAKEDPKYAQYSQQGWNLEDTILPFGSGPRMCIGRRVAENSIHLLLIKILKSFKISCEGEIQLKKSLTLAPKNPVNIKFQDRI